MASDDGFLPFVPQFKEGENPSFLPVGESQIIERRIP